MSLDRIDEFFQRNMFGAEIGPILALICAHEPLDKIDAIPCPRCGAALAIDFQPDGTGFSLRCLGEPAHHSRLESIDSPPPWWRERRFEAKPTTFYWRKWRSVRDDGTLILKTSGYDEDGSHWTGFTEIKLADPDHALWRWIIDQGDRFPDLIDDTELASICADFHRSRN